MKPFLMLSALLLLLVSCTLPRSPFPTPEDNEYVKVNLLTANTKDQTYDIFVEFEEYTELPSVVQEITLGSGETLVEKFDTPNGRFPLGMRDHHSTKEPWPYHSRIMKVYPAHVVGTDDSIGGFAMLPMNQDGSVRTTVGPGFNSHYRENHKIQGRIVESRLDLAIIWFFEYDRGALRITMPDGSIHLFFDPEHYAGPEEAQEENDAYPTCSTSSNVSACHDDWVRRERLRPHDSTLAYSRRDAVLRTTRSWTEAPGIWRHLRSQPAAVT